MTRIRTALFFALIVATVELPVAQQPAPGFADSILGRWDVTVQSADGSYPSWMEVALRKETELMGRFVGRFGSNRHASEVTFRDGMLMMRIPPQYEENKSDLIFKGSLKGQQLEGTTEDANGKTLNWTAVRAPDLVRASAPKWGRAVDLVNGKDLSGWKLRNDTRGNCWSVTNGAATNAPPCVDIITERTFTDFKLHAEFSYVPKSNSGIYLRGRHEVQINDDHGMAADSLRSGGVYGFLRPLVSAAAPANEWQTYDITLIGRRVTVVLNGRTVVDNLEIPGITGGALDSNEGSPGPLMLQGDHGKVMFRKVVLTPAEP